MPGFFGGVGQVARYVSGLMEDFERIWGTIQAARCGDAIVGGHAFAGDAVATIGGETILARDGELGFMKAALDADVSVGEGAAGVLAQAWSDAVEITCDATGLFPVFYAVVPDGILFSTLLKPLATATRAAADRVGIAEFLRHASTFDSRTLFTGIRRLGPGQRLTWSKQRGLAVAERSTLWTSINSAIASSANAAEAIEPLLRDALKETVPAEGAHVLMMSAGWDSRSLLASLRAWFPEADVAAFSHGDLESRELRLARHLCELAGIRARGREIGKDVWNPEQLAEGFSRTETLLFPHWTWAGRVNGYAKTISSGILGEVLGGHYGAMHVAHGGQKILALLKGLTRLSGTDRDSPSARMQAEAFLLWDSLDRPWYLAPGAEEERRGELLAAINQDIVNDLRRLELRGIPTTGQIIEAFVTEHRGAQYIAGQARALRVETDTSVPYAYGPLMEFAASLPQAVKIHNRVNRALGLRVAPWLSRPSLAATLVPATWPLLLQETSRVVRRLYEDTSWTLYRRSHGRLRRARLGWVDFEFLRDGTAVQQVATNLRADLWDRGAFRDLAHKMRTFSYSAQLHPVFDQIGKILTVDHFLA